MNINILSKHAKIILITSFILWLFYFLKWTNPFFVSLETGNFTNIICLFFILSLGISHGALDNLKGEKLLKIFKIKSSFIFYIAYIVVGFLIIFFWILLPTFTLVIFLIVASYHFGKEDSQFALNKKKIWHNFLFLFKGLLIIAAPLYFHNEETINIFKILGADSYFLLKFQPDLIWQYHKTVFVLALLGSLLFFYVCISDEARDDKWLFLSLDSIPILLLNSAFAPLIAFTLYFCFIHSFKHSVYLINLLNKNNFKKGTKEFIKKALPLTLITAILFVVSIFLLSNYFENNDAIIKVIFIGLASLTFPHILLEYLIEKNER